MVRVTFALTILALGSFGECATTPDQQECDSSSDAVEMMQHSMRIGEDQSKVLGQDVVVAPAPSHKSEDWSTYASLFFTSRTALHAAISTASLPYIGVGLACVVVLFALGVRVAGDPGDEPPQADGKLVKDGAEAGAKPERPAFHRRGTFAMVTPTQRAKWTKDDASESMSSAAFVVNMFADLCPPGLLPLAYGLQGTGFVPAFAILFVFYGLCVYTMWTVSRTAEITGKVTFMDQWETVIGKETSWVPVVVVAVVCFGCNLAYACFYGDIFTRLLPTLGLPMPRYVCVLAITIVLTMPLCLLKDLSALAPSSTFAFVCVLYTAGIMVVRWQDGSYAEGGRFYGDLTGDLQPNVPASHMWDFGPQSIVLVNALAVAFLSHYNACKYYRELKGHNPAFFRRIVALAMGTCTVLFGITMVAGYQTFGTAADGVILKNYSREDWPVNVARIGMGLSIVASFPLMFSGLRESVVTLLKRAYPERSDEFDGVRYQDVLSLAMVALIMGCAMLLADVGVVVGIVGSVCGSAIIYIIPCSLYAAALQSPQMDSVKHANEIIGAKFAIGFGVVLGVAGLYATLFG